MLMLCLAALAAPMEVILGEGEGPTVLALHGLGDSPASFSRMFDNMPGPARLLLPAGPHPWRGGYSWLAAGVSLARMADDIAAGLTEPVAVTGFSQGGVLAFALAVRHPDRIIAAFPISGALPESLLPERAPKGSPPIIALHGQDDTTVPVGPTKRMVHQLKRRGFDAELRTWPGVGHEVTPPMRATLSELLTALSH